jgi:hypothetical protein
MIPVAISSDPIAVPISDPISAGMLAIICESLSESAAAAV